MSRNTLITLLPLLTLLFSGCRNNEQEEKPLDPKQAATLTVTRQQFESANMQLGVLEERPFARTVQATGMIDVPPQNKAIASAFMGGYIRETPLLVGDKVKKGQVLVVLENPDFITLQQQYLEAGQQLNYLMAEYERQKQLVEEQISSRKSFLKAESDYKGKLAQYNGLKEKLNMLNFSIPGIEAGNIRSTANIYAPISGSITKMNVSKGTYVSPSDEILEITDIDHIHLELNVFEKDIMDLRKGQRIRFAIPEASEETFEAEVYLVGAHIEENRTVKVHAHLMQEDHHSFLTGMFVQAEVITSEVSRNSLPDHAITELEGIAYALKLVSEDQEGYTFEKIRIDKGLVYEGYTAIEGLSKEDREARYLVNGIFSLITN